MILTPTCWQFLQLFDGKFEPFYTFPFRNHQGFNWMVPDTACPREIVPRGGHPLGLIEYIIERVHQVFLSFEPFEFEAFWNLHQCPPLTFMNHKLQIQIVQTTKKTGTY